MQVQGRIPEFTGHCTPVSCLSTHATRVEQANRKGVFMVLAESRTGIQYLCTVRIVHAKPFYSTIGSLQAIDTFKNLWIRIPYKGITHPCSRKTGCDNSYRPAGDLITLCYTTFLRADSTTSLQGIP